MAVLRVLLHQTPGLLVGALVGGVLGVFVIAPALDRYRRPRTTPTKETLMSHDSGKSPLRLLYEKWAPAVVALALLTGIFGSIGSTINQHETNQETAKRLEQAREFQQCFNQFADLLAGGLPPVRKASAERDSALEDVLTGIQRIVVTATGPTPTSDELTDELRNAARALNAYQVASKHLDAVRAANPYPAPPSQFCDVTLSG